MLGKTYLFQLVLVEGALFQLELKGNPFAEPNPLLHFQVCTWSGFVTRDTAAF